MQIVNHGSGGMWILKASTSVPINNSTDQVQIWDYQHVSNKPIIEGDRQPGP